MTLKISTMNGNEEKEMKEEEKPRLLDLRKKQNSSHLRFSYSTLGVRYTVTYENNRFLPCLILYYCSSIASTALKAKTPSIKRFETSGPRAITVLESRQG